MARLMQVMAVALAVVVAVVPAFAQVTNAQAVSGSAAILPVGEELPDEELLEVDGEFWWFWIVALAVAGALSVYHQWFDGEYGISRDDQRSIAGGAVFAGLGAHWAWGLYGAVALWR